MGELFKYCAQNDVPVMAHCTPTGAESGPGRGLDSDPRYWRRLLSNPALSALRLNLAHFGSDTGRPDFVQTIGSLMRDFPNVYADVGAHDLVESSGSQRTFAYELQALLDDGYDWTKRIMLGTDWHTILRLQRPSEYIDRYLDFFESHFGIGLRSNFQARNALTFLGLDATNPGANRQRLDNFYKTVIYKGQPVEYPNWW
jgi:predicted TIM-barrel fold metal-dependent hydrolase